MTGQESQGELISQMLAGVAVIAFDHSGTLAPRRPPGQPAPPVYPHAAETVGFLHSSGRRLLLTSNVRPYGVQDRYRVLDEAGILGLFAAVLLSAELGVAKPDPLFYRHVIEAAACPPDQVLVIGNNPVNDCRAPIESGLRACLIWPEAEPPQGLPDSAFTIKDLAAILQPRSPAQPPDGRT